MSESLRARLTAFASHVAISVVVAIILLIFLYGVWYPHPYRLVSVVLKLSFVIIAVDLVLGPLMTLILFKKGKKGLWFDMLVVVILQISALVYGLSEIYKQRPYVLAHAIDRFEVIQKFDIDTKELKAMNLGGKPFIGPKLVVAELPEDSHVAMELTLEVSAGGKDIHMLPEYYRDYDQHLDKVAARGFSVDEFVAEQPDALAEFERIAKKHKLSLEELLVYPLVRDYQYAILVLDKNTLKPIDGFKGDPWIK